MKKISVIVNFVNFPWIFKVREISSIYIYSRPKNSGAWDFLAFDVISGITMVASEKNLCEDAIVCVKIIAECKEDVLLESVAIQEALDRSIRLHSLRLSRWHSTRREIKTKEVDWSVRSYRGSDIEERNYSIRVRRYCKKLEIVMACKFFSIVLSKAWCNEPMQVASTWCTLRRSSSVNRTM